LSGFFPLLFQNQNDSNLFCFCWRIFSVTKSSNKVWKDRQSFRLVWKVRQNVTRRKRQTFRLCLELKERIKIWICRLICPQIYLSIKFSSIFFVFLSEGMKGHQGFIALFFEHIATLLCESLYANILSICLSVFAPFRVATVCQSFFMFPSQPISCCIRQFVCGGLLFLTKKWNS